MFHLDFTDQNKDLHHFDLYNTVFTRVRVIDSTANGITAIYATDKQSIGTQENQATPKEFLFWASQIPVFLTLYEPIPGTGNITGGFVQNGKASGRFFRYIVP
jgi:hypothetical protein